MSTSEVDDNDNSIVDDKSVDESPPPINETAGTPGAYVRDGTATATETDGATEIETEVELEDEDDDMNKDDILMDRGFSKTFTAKEEETDKDQCTSKERRALILDGCILILGIIVIGFALRFYLVMGPIMATLSYGAATYTLIVASTLVILVIPLLEYLLFKDSPKAESITELIGLGLTLCILFAGAFLVSYRQFFGGVSAATVDSERDLETLTYAMAVYQECCSIDNPLPQQCEDSGFVYPCYESLDLLNNFAEQAHCSLLEAEGVVSATDPAGCAGQELIPFIREFLSYLDSQTSTTGMVAAVLGGFMFFFSLIAAYDMFYINMSYERRRVQLIEHVESEIDYHNPVLLEAITKEKEDKKMKEGGKKKESGAEILGAFERTSRDFEDEDELMELREELNTYDENEIANMEEGSMRDEDVSDVSSEEEKQVNF